MPRIIRSPGKQVVLAQGTGHSNVSGPAYRHDRQHWNHQVHRHRHHRRGGNLHRHRCYGWQSAGTRFGQRHLQRWHESSLQQSWCCQPGKRVALRGQAVRHRIHKLIRKRCVLRTHWYGLRSSSATCMLRHLKGGHHKFGPSGGTANPAQLITATPYSSTNCLSGLAFSKDGQHCIPGAPVLRQRRL